MTELRVKEDTVYPSVASSDSYGVTGCGYVPTRPRTAQEARLLTCNSTAGVRRDEQVLSTPS